VGDVIAAIATAPGRGGIGIVRLSGFDLARWMGGILGRAALPPRLAVHTQFAGADGAALDDGIALYFPAPHSYTGEDVLELHGHGGPAVLANMAVDSWMPHQFRNLSSRLVTQNGVVLMGLAAVAVLLITGGNVSVLVVLYSINVFLTFSLSLAGLMRYWWKHREDPRWKLRLVLSIAGFAVCAGILVVTVVEKFTEGGWITLIITGLVIAVGLAIRRHYDAISTGVRRADQLYVPPSGHFAARPTLDPSRPTAAFIIGRNRSGLIHASRTVMATWPGFYKNFLVISAQPVDVRSYGGDKTMEALKAERMKDMETYMELARQHGMAAKYYLGFGVDGVEEIMTLCRAAHAEFPHVVFFASKLVFERETWITRLLHNQIVYGIQRKLQLEGRQMMILPMQAPIG